MQREERFQERSPYFRYSVETQEKRDDFFSRFSSLNFRPAPSFPALRPSGGLRPIHHRSPAEVRISIAIHFRAVTGGKGIFGSVLLYCDILNYGVRTVYLKDAMGSVRTEMYDKPLPTPSATVDNSRGFRYTVFGEISVDGSDGKPRISFTGHIFDGESGLIYARARYYDASIGRFVSRDAADLLMPAGLNKYVYGINNPIRYWDPSGNNWWDSLLGGVVGAATGIGAGLNQLGKNFNSFLNSDIGKDITMGFEIAAVVAGTVGLVAASIASFGMADAALGGILGVACLGGAVGMAGGAITAGMQGKDILLGGLVGGAIGFAAGAAGAAMGGGIVGGAMSGFVNGFGNSMATDMESGQNVLTSFGDSILAGGEGALSGMVGGFFGGMGNATKGFDLLNMAGSIGEGALGGGAVGALGAWMSGRDAGRGFFSGAIGGAIGGAVGYMNVSPSGMVSAMVGGSAGALSAGMITYLSGGNEEEIAESAITGGLSGAVSGYENSWEGQDAAQRARMQDPAYQKLAIEQFSNNQKAIWDYADKYYNGSMEAMLNNAQLLANVALDVYGRSDWSKAQLPDYVHKLSDDELNNLGIDPDIFNTSSNMGSGLYYDEQSGKYILAYKGTQDSSLVNFLTKGTNPFAPDHNGLQDWENDVGQSLGMDSQQYKDAELLARTVNDTVGTQNLMITGHSLGGGLASAAGTVTGAQTMTFDAAGLHDNSIGGFQNNIDHPNILALDVKNEVLWNVQDNRSAFANALEIIPPAVGARYIVDPVYPLSGPEYNLHSMDEIIKGLQAEAR
jgi:RHS repeat-associated protein